MRHKKEKHDCLPKPSADPAVSLIESILFNDEEEEPTVQDSKRITCELCDKTFKIESHLNLHMKRFHKQTFEEANEGSIFVAIEEDASTAKQEGTQVEADPFLSDMREKLLQDDDESPNEDVDPMDVFTAVDEALQNDFVIA